MEQYLNEFLLLATAITIALMSPGPDFAITVKQSLGYGKKYAMIYGGSSYRPFKEIAIFTYNE